MIDVPSRFGKLNLRTVMYGILTVAVIVVSLVVSEVMDMSLQEVSEIPINGFNFIRETIPPNFSNYQRLGIAVLETLQMSLVGVVFGTLLSLPLGVLAAKNLSPHPILYYLSRGIISLCRSIPDMVWAIFFVIITGLGPFAGALTLTVDSLGFTGRFFAEAMEETNPAPQEALTSIGATYLGKIFSNIFPACMPSFINIILYSFEKAVQSSVILGLVSAGGIGMLLEEPMTWHDYQSAIAVVLVIFILLVLVEQIGVRVRKTIIASDFNIR